MKPKYTIQIVRTPEHNPMERLSRGHIVNERDFGIERVLFTGEMTPDQTIEVLQHLNDLKQAQLQKVENEE